MNTYIIGKQLIEHEALRLKPYKCPAGKLTIGVGRNLDDVGISKREAIFLLDNDIKACVEDLQSLFFDQFDRLPEKIQHVLIDMRFNLGPSRFRAFQKMIDAVRAESWQDMINEMKDSIWYRQVKSRADNLIRMIEEVM